MWTAKKPWEANIRAQPKLDGFAHVRTDKINNISSAACIVNRCGSSSFEPKNKKQLHQAVQIKSAEGTTMPTVQSHIRHSTGGKVRWLLPLLIENLVQNLGYKWFICCEGHVCLPNCTSSAALPSLKLELQFLCQSQQRYLHSWVDISIVVITLQLIACTALVISALAPLALPFFFLCLPFRAFGQICPIHPSRQPKLEWPEWDVQKRCPAVRLSCHLPSTAHMECGLQPLVKQPGLPKNRHRQQTVPPAKQHNCWTLNRTLRTYSGVRTTCKWPRNCNHMAANKLSEQTHACMTHRWHCWDITNHVSAWLHRHIWCLHLDIYVSGLQVL